MDIECSAITHHDGEIQMLVVPAIGAYAFNSTAWIILLLAIRQRFRNVLGLETLDDDRVDIKSQCSLGGVDVIVVVRFLEISKTDSFDNQSANIYNKISDMSE